MVLRGSDGITIRIVCAYNPCVSAKKATRSTYRQCQQHQRYLLKTEKDRTCPHTRFFNDLARQLRQWRDDGNLFIVCMDANEDIYKKRIGKELTAADGLHMTEVVGNFTGKRIGAIYFQGLTPIDAIWATSDLIVQVLLSYPRATT